MEKKDEREERKERQKIMKKIMKKCFAILLVVAMTLTMTVTAFAEEETSTSTYTLTVNTQKDYDKAVEYAVYQLFRCDLDKNNVPSYKTAGAVNGNLVGTKTVEEISKLQDESDLLYAFAAGISTSGTTAYKTLTTKDTIGVDAGYYLLVPTNLADTADSDSDIMHDKGGTVSAPILVSVPGVTKNTDGTYAVKNDVTVYAKNSEVSHKKKITDVDSVNGTNDTFSESGDTATAGEGDTIKYTITNTVPKYKADVDPTKVNYFVTDTYDPNLTLQNVVVNGTKGTGVEDVIFTAKDGTERIVKRVEGEEADYFVAENTTDHQFIVYFNFDSIKSETNVVIQASFTLNNTATPGTPVVNHSQLTYTNNYYVGNNSDSNLDDEVKSYTFKFNVFKYDTSKTENAALEGAKFGLYKEDGTTLIKEATSGTDGIVNFGILLNKGTYYVKEITAPNGYRVDDHPYKVVISAPQTNNEYDGNYTVTVDDETSIKNFVQNGDITIYPAKDNIPVLGIGNTPGLSLPGTGGMGTTLFTFGGLVLVLVAGIMFVVYIRRQKKQS